jgi:hypothetical protein
MHCEMTLFMGLFPGTSQGIRLITNGDPQESQVVYKKSYQDSLDVG